jgi:hypothetical protein
MLTLSVLAMDLVAHITDVENIVKLKSFVTSVLSRR